MRREERRSRHPAALGGAASLRCGGRAREREPAAHRARGPAKRLSSLSLAAKKLSPLSLVGRGMLQAFSSLRASARHRRSQAVCTSPALSRAALPAMAQWTAPSGRAEDGPAAQGRSPGSFAVGAALETGGVRTPLQVEALCLVIQPATDLVNV